MLRKFFRTRINRKFGRDKFKEEQMNLQRTLELLQSLSEKNCVDGRFVLYHPTKSREIYNEARTPHKSHGLVSIIFNGARDFKGIHQVYYNGRSEMHYIEVSAVLKDKYRGVDMEFLIKNP